MVLLLMVAAVTVADDPILVLGPALARQLHATSIWSGYFIAALGAGTVCGSFRRSRHRPTVRLAATALAALATMGFSSSTESGQSFLLDQTSQSPVYH